MTREADAKSARLFDRRTVERSIKKGLVTRKDYEKHLKALPDITDKGTHGTEEPDDADDDDMIDEGDDDAGPDGTSASN